MSAISSGRSTAAVFTLDLVGSCSQHPPGVGNGADAAADGERDEHLLGHPADHADGRLAAVARRRDVEEHQLVGAFGVVARRQLDGVAGVAQVEELRPLDHATGGDVEARDHPGDLHARTSAMAAIAPATVMCFS